MSGNDAEELLRSVEATIKDAEQHLGVPNGVLGDIRHDTDYLAIVKHLFPHLGKRCGRHLQKASEINIDFL